MSKESERLFSALGQISDRYLEEAAQPPRQVHPWRRWGTAAACVGLIAMTVSIFPHLGGCGASPGGAPETAEPENAQDAAVFQSYAGPILPLTVREPAPGITAARSVTLDFAPWLPREDHSYTCHDLRVEDCYQLTNGTDKEQTLTVQLPFVSSVSGLNQSPERTPELFLEEEPLAGTLVPGGSGAAWELDSWQALDALLSNGSYRKAAADRTCPTLDTPVTVYTFTDPWGPEETEEAPNPSIRAGLRLDYDRTQVLTWGFHSASYDREGGTMLQGFSIPDGRGWNPEQRLLIVLGEDLRDLTTGGYVTGGTDPDTPPLADTGVSVTRKKSTLGEALEMVFDSWYGLQQTGDFPAVLPRDTLYALFLEEVRTVYRDPTEINRRGGWLEDLLEQMESRGRVFWVEAAVTIPAGESRTLTALSLKAPSHDYCCGGTGDEDLSGFDLMPWLDSALTFTGQTARLEDRGMIRIVRQNFGFAPEQGRNTVVLEENQPHYYLEVTEKAGTH